MTPEQLEQAIADARRRVDELTADRLRELLNYSAETGVFTQRKARSGTRVGEVAGSVKPNGYIHINLNGVMHKAHRLAWLYIHGVWPESGIDHRDGNPSNNRIDNLRQATPSENMQNRKPNEKSSSKYIGVGFHKHSGKYRARIRVNGEVHNLGLFKTEEEAYSAYCAAKKELHTFQRTPRDLISERSPERVKEMETAMGLR